MYSSASHLLPIARPTGKALRSRGARARILSLKKLMHALKHCRAPIETLRAIRRGVRDVYGSHELIMLSTRGQTVGEYRLVDSQLGDHDTGDSDSWKVGDSPVHRGGLFG